jgi:hypothetical protein
MDIQGAELMALRGLDQDLGRVKMIHTEVEFFEIYRGAPLFREIRRYLNQNGFLLVGFTNFGSFSGDAVFLNKSILSGRMRVEALISNAFAYPAHRLVALAARAAGRMRRLSRRRTVVTDRPG